MIDCLVAGDSIAVGVGAHLPCYVDAKVGIPSAAIIGRTREASLLIVSAGSNDPHNSKLRDNLESIRAKAHGKVIWILPVNQAARQAVIDIAHRHGDATVGFDPGRDGLHPRSYKALAEVIGSML